MEVLAVKNISVEGPGTLGLFLEKQGCRISYVDFEKRDKLPSSPDGFSLVLFMGGPMNVYEENQYPFLRDELRFLEQCLKKGTKTIGLCLGAQMMARALGAKVKKNREKEIGWFDLELTQKGMEEPLLKGLPKNFGVFQWHGDTFDIPSGAAHLARSALCENQAFIHGNALALQFHAEINGEQEVMAWSELYRSELMRERGARGMEQMMAETRRFMPLLKPNADIFYQNIHRWITGA